MINIKKLIRSPVQFFGLTFLLCLSGFATSVYAAPVAGFTVSGQCLNSFAQFTDASRGSIRSWQWTFENASPANSTLTNPQVKFTSSGPQKVQLIVTDVLGLKDTSEIYVFVIEMPSVSITPSNIVICAGSSLDLQSSISSSNYNYLWNTGAVTPQITVSPNSAVTYTLTIKDKNSACSSSAIAEVSVSGPVFKSLNTTSSQCGETKGSIIVSASGGTAPLSYSLENGPFKSVGQFDSLAAGFYTVMVSDAVNCKRTQKVAVTDNNSNIVFNAAASNVKCFGDSSGTIQLTASNGNAPYTYTIAGKAASTNSMFSNLLAGTYSVMVTDSSGCHALTSVVINQAQKLAFNIVSAVGPKCGGSGNSGSISFVASGGVAPYSYYLDGVSQSSSAISNLSAGTYLVSVSDKNNCPVEALSVVLLPPTPVQLSLSVRNAKCFGSNDGAINLTASGGNGLQYAWSNSATTSNISNLSAGSYSVIVSNNQNCTASAMATVSEGPEN